MAPLDTSAAPSAADRFGRLKVWNLERSQVLLLAQAVLLASALRPCTTPTFEPG